MKISGPGALAILTVFSSFLAQGQSGFFGNSPNGSSFGSIGRTGAGLGYRNEIAISFTPLQTFNFSYVTVWLSGYDGNNGQSLLGYIMDDPSDSNYYPPYTSPTAPLQPSGGPGQNDLALLKGDAPNDGSLAAFTLSAGWYYPSGFIPSDLTLYANMDYWLIIDVDGSIGTTTFANVAGSDIPTGNAIYNETEYYDPAYGGLTGAFIDPDISPAFVINGVPEPSTKIFTLFGGAGLLLFRSRKKCSRAGSFS